MLDVHEVLDKYNINEAKFFQLMVLVTRIAKKRSLKEKDYIKYLNGSFNFTNDLPPQELINLLYQEIMLNLSENVI